MRCEICKKLLKENTLGNDKYCQGHSIFEKMNGVKKNRKAKKCSICGQLYVGWGNNAQPINDGRCCNECNSLVIYERIARSLARR